MSEIEDDADHSDVSTTLTLTSSQNCRMSRLIGDCSSDPRMFSMRKMFARCASSATSSTVLVLVRVELVPNAKQWSSSLLPSWTATGARGLAVPLLQRALPRAVPPPWRIFTCW